MSFGALLMFPFGDICGEMCCIVKESMNACNYLIIIMNFVMNSECVFVCENNKNTFLANPITIKPVWPWKQKQFPNSMELWIAKRGEFVMDLSIKPIDLRSHVRIPP